MNDEDFSSKFSGAMCRYGLGRVQAKIKNNMTSTGIRVSPVWHTHNVMMHKLQSGMGYARIEPKRLFSMADLSIGAMAFPLSNRF